MNIKPIMKMLLGISFLVCAIVMAVLGIRANIFQWVGLIMGVLGVAFCVYAFVSTLNETNDPVVVIPEYPEDEKDGE